MVILRAVPAPAARARAASSLVALARAGYVKDADLRALGRVILGRDLDTPRWRLPGVGKVRVRAGVVAGFLRAALALAFTPRRVRIGTRWLKAGTGRVDGSCIPADLPPGDLAMWLRAATLGFLRDAVTDRDRPMREEHAPEGFEGSESPFLSEYTNRMAAGLEEDLIARETLAGYLALPSERDRTLVMLRVQGYTTVEIALRLGVTDRTVRRYLHALRERATEAGILDDAALAAVLCVRAA